MSGARCLMIGLLLAAPASAEEPETKQARSAAALEILEKVDQAIKAVHSVRYEARSIPSGVAVNFGSATEGTAVMVGWNGSLPEKFYSHVRTRREGLDEMVEMTGGGNGESYFLIDHRSKKAYEDMDPGVMGSDGRAVTGFGMVEFVHDKPFDDELGADRVELLDPAVVEGEECHQILVDYGAGEGSSTWSFSKKDYLPRRRVRSFSVPGQGEGSFEITVSKLEVNFEPDESLFVMKLPEGYERIDDFAP